LARMKFAGTVMPDRIVFFLIVFFFHPDFNCWYRSRNGSAFRLADFTANREFHPALKIVLQNCGANIRLFADNNKYLFVSLF